jgi:alanyl-tRNA synthetase
MLGHFSFGDYFKAESVAWAWEFLRKVCGFPADLLRVSVYQDDDEAYRAWRAQGLSDERIRRFDARENYWPANAPEAGPNGPCGPCSEIFFDYGKEAEKGDGGPNGYDSGRYVEIWNMVFTQFDRRGVNDLVPLPQRNIDTGAGFERILAALEGQRSPFGTTLLRPVLERVAHLCGKPYAFDAGGAMPQGPDAVRMRRIADHARAACMVVADGVKPSNEGRGYVLRRVLRRAIRDGIQLGLDAPFLARLVDPVVDVMSGGYPTLREGVADLRSVLEGEESRFRETYANGVRYLEEEVARLGSAKVLPGEAAFRLYDTYGFPLDLAELILEERGIAVDRVGFDREMEAQRERARRGSKIKGDIFAGGPLTELKARGVAPTVFTGHEGDGTAGEATVVGILRGERLVERAEEGDDVGLVLDRTPFYASSGGQVGDTGEVLAPSGRFVVEDTPPALEGFTVHAGRVASGHLTTGLRVSARVDAARRDAIRRNHTATHLLHRVLKHVLGDVVRQEGSLVAPDRLRFDFSFGRALTDDEVRRVERLMNEWIVRNEPATTEVQDLETAKRSGAVAMFGEKYAAKVRVLDVPGGSDVGGASRELCGGTHVRRTGDIGSFRVTSEASIAAGVRRVEAVTGLGATAAFDADRRVLRELSDLLKAKPEGLGERVRALQDELREVRRAAEKARLEASGRAADRLATEAAVVNGRRVQVAAVPGADAKALKGVWERLQRAGVEAAVLVGDADGKTPVFAAVEAAARASGLDARDLLQSVCGVLGGRGGGRPEMAQGQAERPDRTEDALAAVRQRIAEVLSATAAS